MRKRIGWGSIVVMWCGVSWGLAQDIELAAPSAVGGEVPSGVDVLARGPIHEAFAELVSPDPEPGLIVPKRPPAPIEEVPPEWRPEGDDIEWIPGYWFWDDDRRDFVWVSGVWRRVPPGRRWVPGYWQAVASGYQWTPGFWGTAEDAVVTYLDTPPASLDTGPSSTAPVEDMFWIPGNWEYHVAAYRWRPGHWHPFRADWTWVSARFVWTPRGCVFIPGYWDYTLTRRGFLFAPVCFSDTIYLRPGFSYRPTYWIGADAMLLHLFVSPACQHLYFGDYYATQYRHRHFVPCYDYHARHQGFASLYVYYEHHYRHHGIDYCNRVRQWHDTYARRADLRPPHTYSIQRQHHGHRSQDLFTEVVRPFHGDGGGELGRVGGQQLVPITGRDHDLMRSETKRLRSLATERNHFESESLAANLTKSRLAKGKQELATFTLPEARHEVERSRSFKKAPPTLTHALDPLTRRKLPQNTPDRQTVAGISDGTQLPDGNRVDGLRKRTPRLPLASDSNVELADPSENSGGVANEGVMKGRSLRRLGLNPDALGPTAGTTDSAATSGSGANGGAMTGRSSRRGVNLGLDSAGAAGVQTGGADASSAGIQLPLSSAQTRMKAELPPAARKAMLDAAARRDNLKLDRLRLGNQGTGNQGTGNQGTGNQGTGNQFRGKRVRSGAEAGALQGSAGNLGSEMRSSNGPRFSAETSRALDRVRSASKGQGSGGE
jgi:hypothetical protein